MIKDVKYYLYLFQLQKLVHPIFDLVSNLHEHILHQLWMHHEQNVELNKVKIYFRLSLNELFFSHLKL
jgi:hypothetical protein